MSSSYILLQNQFTYSSDPNDYNLGSTTTTVGKYDISYSTPGLYVQVDPGTEQGVSTWQDVARIALTPYSDNHVEIAAGQTLTYAGSGYVTRYTGGFVGPTYLYESSSVAGIYTTLPADADAIGVLTPPDDGTDIVYPQYEVIQVDQAFNLIAPTPASFALSEGVSGAITTPARQGSLDFTDEGASSLPSLSVTGTTVTATDSHGNAVDLSPAHVSALEGRFALGSVTGGPDRGTSAWTYDPSGTALSFLTAGETVTLDETIAGTDSFGATTTTDLTIQLQGPSASTAGFDISAFPGLATTDWLRQNTNLEEVGFYLPMAPSHRDGSWSGKLASLLDQGWDVAPIYVGRQADSLDGNVAHLGDAPNDASAQGQADGDGAVIRAQTQGFAAGTTIYLDVESPLSAVRSDQDMQHYIANWIKEVSADGYTAGVYSYVGTDTFIRNHISGSVASWATSTAKQATYLDAIDSTSSGGSLFTEANPAQSGVPGANAYQYAIDLPIAAGNRSLKVDLDTFS